MTRRYFYLAGPISGETFEGAGNWRNELTARWYGVFDCPHVKVLDPLRGLAPTYGSKVWRDARWPGTVDYTRLRDFADIDRSDVIVFGGLDTAKKVSIGSMIEWGYAMAKGKKILVLDRFLREGTAFHHHPWLSYHDFRATSIADAVRLLRFYFADEPHNTEPIYADRGSRSPGPPPMGLGEKQSIPDGDHAVGRRVAHMGDYREGAKRQLEPADQAGADVQRRTERANPAYPLPEAARASGSISPLSVPGEERERTAPDKEGSCG